MSRANFDRRIILVIACILCVIAAIVSTICLCFNDHTYTVTVTGKERVNNDDGSKYLIFGEKENGETLVVENVDSILRGKFNSSDFYGQLKIGNKYEITVVGARVPFSSMYENVIAFKLVEQSERKEEQLE